MEPHSMEEGRSTSRKRRKETTRAEEIMRLEDELELVRHSMEELEVEIKNEKVSGSEKDAEKDSLRIPAVDIEVSPVRNIISNFEESLVISLSDAKKTDAKKLGKSTLKLLIDKYENMRVENETASLLNEKCVFDEKCDNGQSEADVCVMPVVSSAKPTEGGNKSSMMGGKMKKKVWVVKKNGLYGWKMVVVDKPTSTNIHTQKINTQPTSKPKVDSKSQQNILLRKWLVTPKRNEGGGGPESDICEVLTSENTDKITEKESLENFHTDGFNHPRPDSQHTAKTDGD